MESLLSDLDQTARLHIQPIGIFAKEVLMFYVVSARDRSVV